MMTAEAGAITNLLAITKNQVDILSSAMQRSFLGGY